MKTPVGKLAALIGCLCIALMPMAAAAKAAPEALKANLHRLDFRVEGASCVTCLRRIGQTFRTSPGVLKADVSIYRPYWAIVIYDLKKTNLNKLTDAIKNEHVKLVDVEDKPISTVPAVVIPKSISGASG